MDELERYLIIGLGNPGDSYRQTRHNVGFRLVQSFVDQHRMSFKHTSHLLGDLAQGSVHEKKVLALLPTTFMNSSGESVRRCVDYFKLPLDHLIVVCDDVALPMGTMRLRSKGSSGGHNGLKSIEDYLHTEYYARLRIGVGAPEAEKLADYVLGRFSQDESKMIESMTLKVIEVLNLWVGVGIAAAMQTANSLNKKEEGEKNG